MQKNLDNTNGAVSKPPKAPKAPKPPKQEAEAQGSAPGALIVAILFVSLIIAGGMMLWFNIVDARTATVEFLQRIDPESKVQTDWIENEYVQLMAREDRIDEREKRVAQREKELDAIQMDLEQRETEFMAQQEDPGSPVTMNAIYLAGIYSALTPEAAAEVLVTLDDLEQIKRILRNMPDDQVSAIMELMPRDFAADLTASILGKESY